MSNLARKKEVRRLKAEQEGRQVRTYTSTGIQAADVRQWKIEYKRQQRVKRAKAEGRVLLSKKRQVLHDAHAICYMACIRSPKHDAHVLRFHAAMSWRAKSKARYYADPVKGREKGRQKKASLVRSYVVCLLTCMGIPRCCITEEMIDMKREQLTLRRLARQLKKAAINSKKESL